MCALISRLVIDLEWRLIFPEVLLRSQRKEKEEKFFLGSWGGEDRVPRIRFSSAKGNRTSRISFVSSLVGFYFPSVSQLRLFASQGNRSWMLIMSRAIFKPPPQFFRKVKKVGAGVRLFSGV